MPHHDVFPTPDTVHWGYLDARRRPVIEIDPGDTVTIHSVSGSPAEASRNPAHSIRPELQAIHEALAPSPGPHILTGPIHIRGAKPGDALRVEILDVRLRDDWGFNIIRPGKGALPRDFTQDETLHLSIGREAGTIVTPWGMVMPARPFFGIMATAPKPEDGCLTSIIPGYFGGNMDNRELTAGSIIYLPVSVEGALFSAGDGHASQGDGEVCLTAVETGLSGTFKIDVIRGAELAMPYAETASHLITMAFDEDLQEAMREALRFAIGMIVERTHLTSVQAYSLCSMAADVRITQVVNVKKGVHIMIPKALIAQSARDA
ncbi:acetamidase/formamidase family protein [Rhizobium sp. 16-449-1b]|uniref:acetamidase/formamidase family protein n=1 Tax=Rhizobium sp. 16-449-1b TaxID=2819989 RepID=UPI001ADAE41F|nr:acetamidase/formamidase family protein [Rhizobium sp. 16-449-1b]MBO9197009.1 acetamidase/formamidase family protein [Rhizobium sp. 16-449-1b]